MSNNTENSDVGGLRRHDLIVSGIAWCIALATLIESWRLTFHLELPGIDKQQAWLVAPGIFPLALSFGLLVIFSVILWVSLKEGEFKGHFAKNNALSFFRDRGNLSQIIQVALLCLYVFCLLGRIHFGIASALYLFASMFTARAAKWPIILIISILFAAATTYLFGTVMKIPLP